MIDIARELARVRYPVLAVSALAWGAMATGSAPFSPSMDIYCSTSGPAAVASASLAPPTAFEAPWARCGDWALMIVAMMLPLVVPQIHHLRFTSLKRRRARSIVLFVAGYGGVWMLCGAVLTGTAAMILASGPGPYWLVGMAGVAACVFQASPAKQRCLNGCHDNPPLRAFGFAADLDALRYGGRHGLWCAGSCSSLMLLALLVPQWHLAAMMAIAVLIFCERLDAPELPRWKMRGFGRAWRMTTARLRIRWRLRDGADPVSEAPLMAAG